MTVAVAGVAVAVAGATAVPDNGMFGGGTSQLGNGLGVRFRVSGSEVMNETVFWSARCRSGTLLSSGTLVPKTKIVRGAWSAGGHTYVYALRPADYRSHGRVVSHERVIQNEGRFTSPISATGVWRLSAVLFQQGRRIDSCSTGVVRWAAGTVASGSPSPLIVPANTRVGGFTYAQWEAKAWQWDTAFVRSYHSRAPSTSRCVSNGQQGPVWFLDSDYYDLGNTFTVTCNIPAGRYVFLDLPAVDCSTVEPPPHQGSTDAALLRCAHSYRPATSSLAFDGQVLSPSGFVLATDAFPFTMPPTDNFLGVRGKTSGRIAVYGRALMFGPLTPGVHTLIQVQRYPGGPFGDVTFRLTVS